MAEDVFEKLDTLSREDTVRIYLSNNTDTSVAGVTIENPFETTVEGVYDRRLDEKKGHDVEGIITKKEIHIDPPDHDDIHGEYVIETKRSLDGEKSVSPIEAREYFEGRPGDGKYAIHVIGFIDIEILD